MTEEQHYQAQLTMMTNRALVAHLHAEAQGLRCERSRPMEARLLDAGRRAHCAARGRAQPTTLKHSWLPQTHGRFRRTAEKGAYDPGPSAVARLC